MNLSYVLPLAALHAAALRALLASPVYVEDITEAGLKSLGAEAVVFDHDGVLGPSMSERPDETGMEAMARAGRVFGEGRVFILSNTRTRRSERKKTYAAEAPEAHYIEAGRKPDPEGLMIASREAGVPVDKIAVIDDGMLTGVLMAVANGAIPVYARRKRLDEDFHARAVRLIATLPQIAIVRLFSLVRPGG